LTVLHYGLIIELTPEFIAKYVTVNAIPTTIATTTGINICKLKN